MKETEGYWQVWIMAPDGSSRIQLTSHPEDKVNLSWSKDRRRLMATTAGGKVMVIDIESKESEEINSIPGITDSVWSPDGKLIAFSQPGPGGQDTHDIWTLDLETKEKKKLTNIPGLQHEPAWGWDGSFIVFLSGKTTEKHDLMIVDNQGNEARALLEDHEYNFEAACSSQGDIAFSSNNSGNYEIYSINQTGENLKQLTDNTAYDAEPSWSPDGQWIAFVSDRSGNRQVWLMNRHGKELKELTQEQTGVRKPTWSRGGE